MNPTADRESYSYLGIQARPPRRRGRDRRRLDKENADSDIEEQGTVQEQQEERPVVTDPLSPYVEELFAPILRNLKVCACRYSSWSYVLAESTSPI